MSTYLKNVAEATIQHVLSIQPYTSTPEVSFGDTACVYLATIGFILSNRPDLIEDSELRTKLGFSEQVSNPHHQEGVAEQEQIKSEEGLKDVAATTFQHIPFIRPVSTEQVKTAPEQLNKVTLYPDFNVEELRPLLLREILLSTSLPVPDAEEFATYLIELDQFKCILNSVFDTISPFNSHYRNHTQSPMEGVLQTALRTDSRRSRVYMAIKSTLVKMDMHRLLRLWYASCAKEKTVVGDIDKKVVTIVAEATRWLLVESENPEDFAHFLVQQSLFKAELERIGKIPVITHLFGRRSKSLDEAVEDTLFVIPTRSILEAWRLNRV